MRLTFRLRFYTHPGQSLFLTGDHPMFGDGDFASAIALSYLNSEFWQATLELPPAGIPKVEVSYRYVLREADGSLVEDWGQGRSLNPVSFASDELLILDSWNSPAYVENAFYTEPFRNVFLRSNHTEVRSAWEPEPTHTFRVKAPLLAKGQTLCLLGNRASLGGWDVQRPVLLRRPEQSDFYSAALDLREAVFPIEYKYGVYDVIRETFAHYEDGPNRVLSASPPPTTHTLVNDGFARLPTTTWKGAGVAIPVFSLRSERSFGIGEFTDLKLLADWCRRTGLKLIQILPINDTMATGTWLDSYPYAAISAFALHPIYLNLDDLATPTERAQLAKLGQEWQRLNALAAVDYEAVLTAKLRVLRQVYSAQWEQIFNSKNYQVFFQQNEQWLVAYACFSFLRDKYGTPDFNHWPEHQRFDPSRIAELASPASPVYAEIAFYYFVQYHLHRQLQDAAAYVHAQGVVLKGDIAIGVHRFGADAWQHPELFHMEMQAGAPPDAFGINGQNWSFPTYNWRRMQEDGFRWWKLRFEQMGRYFDAFRIDHILGFFRIWSVPRNAVEGILGYFVPAIPVKPKEFFARDIPFDRERFTRPHITEANLSRSFGMNAAQVKARFLAPSESGQYQLKPEFATQRQVEDYFARLQVSDLGPKIKEGLFDLISDVILLEPEGASGHQFHFRFGMQDTGSFRDLPRLTQERLQELYTDYFYRRQEEFWSSEGLKKLPALKRATNMLICGEDLGMVPACVPQVMKDLGLLSLEVQRMPKNLGQEFFRPGQAPYLSVITPSTHDMSTIRGWWQEDRGVIQRFYTNELGQPGPAPETCEPWINKMVIQQHLASPAMWSIFQLQDLLGMDRDLRRDQPDDERINTPANPRNYWHYRIHLTLEELNQVTEFNRELKCLIQQEGR